MLIFYACILSRGNYLLLSPTVFALQSCRIVFWGTTTTAAMKQNTFISLTTLSHFFFVRLGFAFLTAVGTKIRFRCGTRQTTTTAAAAAVAAAAMATNIASNSKCASSASLASSSNDTCQWQTSSWPKSFEL